MNPFVRSNDFGSCLPIVWTGRITLIAYFVYSSTLYLLRINKIASNDLMCMHHVMIFNDRYPESTNFIVISTSFFAN